MKKRIIDKMQLDMGIQPYRDETQSNYVGRLVYSALCQWMRYSIIDETTQYYDRKSKSYLLSKMEKLLDNMVASFPETQTWICGRNYDRDSRADLIRELREKMLSCGELLEVDEAGNIGLPSYSIKACTMGYARIYGLSGSKENKFEYVGVTRVCKKNDPVKTTYWLEEISLEKYLKRIYTNATWNKMQGIDGYEFFNPKSKKPPYQSWTNTIPSSEQYILARTSLYNGLHEYCLIKRDGAEISNSLLVQVLTEWKEERRIILALRKNANNSMQADYIDRGDVCILNLFCGLPLREQIALDTFCWPLNSMGDKYNYVVPKFLWEDIRVMMNNVGITLREKNNG
jgi:hypothetical protein